MFQVIPEDGRVASFVPSLLPHSPGHQGKFICNVRLKTVNLLLLLSSSSLLLLLFNIHTGIDGIETGLFIGSEQQQVA